jgi:hypothetical protein
MVLSNPRANHHIHVALLAFVLFSALAITALSAAFLVRARDYWFGKCRDCPRSTILTQRPSPVGYFTKPFKLMMSASVVTIVTTLVL